MKGMVAMLGIVILILSPLPSTPGDGEHVKIVSTLQIFSTIARDIGGDMVEVDYIVPQGTDIHDYSLTERDLAKIQNADLVILANSNFFSIDREIRDSVSHHLLDFEDYNATIMDIPNLGKDFHGYWLYPPNAINIGRAIKKELISLDMEHGDYYERNFRVFENEVERAEGYMKSMERIFALENKTALLAVPGVFYVLKSLNVNVWATILKGPNQFISPDEMSTIEREIKKGKIDFIVNAKNMENSKAGEIAREISMETGIKILDVDIFSCENYTDLLMKNTAIVSSYQFSATYKNENCDCIPYMVAIFLLSVLLAFVFYVAYRYRKELLNG